MLRAQNRRFAAVLAAAVAGLFTSDRAAAQVAGQNVNMVSGTQWPGGDPFLQRQNEPSIAVSTRNPLHLLAGANDYRTVDLPTEAGGIPGGLTGDAWLGLFKSFDGGLSWQSTLLPGFPQDNSPDGLASPLKAYAAAADPTVRAGTSGLFYYSGIAFNRGTNIGAVFVTSLLDANQKENGDATQGRDTMKYLRTVVVDTGTSGQFLDKPWIAVDVPRPGAATCTFSPFGTAQSFSAGNVYIVWSRFTGSTSTKIMFSRSFDCGKTWSNPIKLSESNSINQGTNLAIDPSTGHVYVTWRRFASSSQPDAIVFAKSTDFGKSFPSKNTVQVAAIAPFDQSTTGTRFRTNTLPSIAVSVDTVGKSRIHLAWAQRDAVTQDARIVLSTSANGGQSWSAPSPVDGGAIVDDAGSPFSRGHQVMPQITFAAGRLMLLYYDQRLDHTLGLFTPNEPFLPDPVSGAFYRQTFQLKAELLTDPPSVFNPFIDDVTLTRRRHTIDLRVARALPADAPAFSSATVSQYRIGLWGSDANGVFYDDEGQPVGGAEDIHTLSQLQVNVPNLPLFAQGTMPFFGDYIDIAGQPFVKRPDGTWGYNTSSSNPAVFHATWTDNRDVKPPLDGDWTRYTPAGGGGTSVLDPTKTTPACITGQEGMRNQNIYSSRITEGLLVGSPQNVKPLSPTLKRAFVVTLQNLTAVSRVFTVSLSPAAGVNASFLQGSARTSIDVTIPARSGAARPVFAISSSPAGSITVNVEEKAGTCAGACLAGFAILNPEGSVSPLAQPDGTTADIASLEIYTPVFSLWNPANPNPFLNISNPNEALNISNLNISNLNISNADPAILNISNLNISNLNISNLNISNPSPAVLNISNLNISNTTAANLNISNLNISNLNISNLNISNTAISDTTYAVSNTGNTTHSYRVALYGNKPYDVPLNVVVTKNTSTPTSIGCTLQNQPQNVVLASAADAPVAATLGEATDPNIPGDEASNLTMALAPGETVFVTLRAALSPEDMALLTRGLTPVVTAHGANTNGAGNDFAMLLFIQTAGGTTLPTAVVGTSYSYTFQASGGRAPLTWALASGSLPAGLTLSSLGVLSGTPTAGGSYVFTLQVQDATSPAPQTATQTFSMTVSVRTTSTALSLAKNPVVVDEPVAATVTVTDMQPDGTASFPSGTVTVGPGPVSGSCSLAPTATPGVSRCAASLNAGGVGSYPLTAAFAATEVHAASSSPPATLTVNPRATATSIAFSPNPVTILSPTAVTATLADVDPAGTKSSPAGLVTFSSDVSSDTFSNTSCAPTHATATTSACSVTLTPSTNAARTITASYGGSPVHAASASGAGPVVRGNTTTTITSDAPAPSALGQAVTVAFTVAPVSPAVGTPTGMVTVTVGGGGSCSAALVSGSGSCAVTPAALGSVTLTATYAGDSGFNGSAGTRTHLVFVFYTFTGFGSPLASAGSLSSPSYSGVQNLGSATPIKFQLFDYLGANVMDLAAVTSITAVPNATCSGAATGTPILLYSPTAGATGGSTFRSSSTGYVFNWDTSVVVPNGPGCYTIVVQLNDPSAPRATTLRLQ